MNPFDWGRGDTVRPKRWPVSVLALVEERQGGRFCVFCRKIGLVTPADIPIEVDHKQPLSQGGDNHHLNLQFACRSHNRGRGDRKYAPRIPKWKRKKR